MILRAWRTAVRSLASAGLAVGLLVSIGVWSGLATVVAQGDAADAAVVAWAAKYPLLEPVVRFLGLHSAFTSYVFLALVFLLGISTAVCAWRRTRIAFSRSRALGSALRVDASSLATSHDLEIECDPALSEAEILSKASDALALQGIKTKRRGALLIAASSPVSVWGSTVFHWALVMLIVVILGGQMLRSEGSMAVAVGETRADQPASYESVHSGPWYDWGRTDRSIRVDSFEPDYKTGGIGRGAVPTVSVLDGAGEPLVSQRVYPNNMLHSGSLAINVPAVGLSVWLASIDASGSETGRMVQHVDFSQDASGGTRPVRALTRKAAGAAMRMALTVPLDRFEGGYGEWIPKKPTARLLVTTAEGKVLLDRVVDPGEDVVLPGGDVVRLLGVGWYARLSLVDDPTIWLIYSAMIIAMLGLTMTVVFRQQLVVATVLQGPGGPVLAMRLRLWRNVPTNRNEIQGGLTRALGSREKGSIS